MANDTSTGGTLSPSLPLPLDDDALDAVLQSLITQVSGLDGSFVRPRWQPTPPKQPEADVNWIAFGVTSAEPDAGPWLYFDQVNEQTLYWRHEQIETLATFYGPQSKSIAALVRDGLSINQNLEPLRAYAMGFCYSGTIRRMPELYNQTWINRYDMTLTFRRKVIRTYAALSLLIADVNLIDDTVVNDTIIVPPGAAVVP